MNSLNKNIEIAERHCRGKGEKLTKKRKIILAALFKSQKALSAYGIVDLCKKEFDEVIPPMSVYRILDFLQGQGLVHKLNLANKYVACSHIICDKKYELLQFLICDQCQRVEEIDINPSVLKQLRDNVDKVGFHLSSPQLEINGICSQCFTAPNG